MAARTLKAQVVLYDTDGTAKDAVVNDFAITTSPTWDPATQLAQITSPLANFYNHVEGAGQSIAHFLSSRLTRAVNGIDIKLFDVTGHLDGSPAGSPLVTDHFTLAAAGTSNNMPGQISVCLTLRGTAWDTVPVEVPDDASGVNYGGVADVDTKPDRPRQRHTGRIYIGPLNAVDPGYDVDKDPKVAPTLKQALLDNSRFLQDQLKANGHEWAVWSRKDRSMISVIKVEVDNRYDVVKKRVQAPTARFSRILIP